MNYLKLIISFFLPFLTALILFKLYLKLCKRYSIFEVVMKGDSLQLDEINKGKQNTPTMGGIIIIIVTLFFFIVFNIKDIDKVLSIILFIIAFGIIGFIDDLLKMMRRAKGIIAKQKLLFQFLFAFLSCVYLYNVFPYIAGNVYIPILAKKVYISNILSLFFSIFIIVASSNAVNLTDGIDGLSASSLIICFLALLSFILFRPGSFYNPETIAVMLAVTIGATSAYLIFNFHPAKVFMGNVGSSSLGALLGVFALIMKVELFLPLIALVFVLDTLSVILQVSYFKLSGGKRIFKIAPLHHHYQFLGFSEIKVVFYFSLLTVFSSLLAVVLFINF